MYLFSSYSEVILFKMKRNHKLFSSDKAYSSKPCSMGSYKIDVVLYFYDPADFHNQK